MTDPCNKGPDIDILKKEQQKAVHQQIILSNKVDQLLVNQKETSDDLKQAINKLTAIIELDIETRKDVEQLKKDRDAQAVKLKVEQSRITAIEVRNAKCDGLGIFNKWDEVWNFIQQEKGWRRFVPVAMAIISTGLAIYITLADANIKSDLHQHPVYSGVTIDAPTQGE